MMNHWRVFALVVTGFCQVPQQVQSPAPAFEVATIKPRDANVDRVVGFVAYPGGKVYLSGSVRFMVGMAFDAKHVEIAPGSAWVDDDWYTVVALPPGYEEQAANAKNFITGTPSAEQRKMIETLLAGRFGLKVHRELREFPVLLLERGSGALAIEPAKDENRDARANVMTKSGGIVDGEAFGQNATMPLLARMFGVRLGKDVIDRTGLTGVYDFHLPANDPQNEDMSTAVFDVVKRLGLKLRASKAPIETIVIDSVTRPTGN